MQTGDLIPSLTGRNQDGREIALDDFRGKKLALYFYPKDSTSGCTAEACSFRDRYETLLAKGYAILGVSPDSERSHQNFIAKNALPFPLIADTDKTWLQAFGVWGEKKMYGRTYMGVFRTTFLIDETGHITHIFGPKEIKTKTHADQVLAIAE